MRDYLLVGIAAVTGLFVLLVLGLLSLALKAVATINNKKGNAP